MREFAHVLAVCLADVHLGHAAGSAGRFVIGHGHDDGLDVFDAGGAGNRHRVGPAQLAPVPFLGVVRRGDHDRTVGLERSVGEIAHRGGSETHVDDVHSLVVETLGERREQAVGRFAAIARHHHFFDLREAGIGAGDLVEDAFVQILPVDATDIIRFEDTHVLAFLFRWFDCIISYFGEKINGECRSPA